MSELFEIGDRCTVMRDGEYIGTVKLSRNHRGPADKDDGGTHSQL